MNRATLIAPGMTVALLLAGIAIAAPVAGVGFGAAPSERDAIVLRASVVAKISPGTDAPVRLTASNTGSSAATISTVHLVDIVADASHANCVTTDFTMTDIAQHASVPAGARDYPLADGTLAFHNTNVSQDACKGAALTLTFSST